MRSRSTILEREIEAVMTARLGRPCLFAPSGRVALYVALRAWLEPGDRILMSPVNDDVIFFTVLAAGLRPVMAPLSPEDGNIDPSSVEEDVWPTLAAVLTTNLYGLPDRVQDLRSRCSRLGILLIEDAAHAIETAVEGKLIGTFGDAAVFSLSKHVGAHGGGILAFGEEAQRPGLERLRDAAIAPAQLRDRVSRAAARAAEELVTGLHLLWPARWLRRRLGLVERTGYRMPLRAVELRAAAAGPGLERFDQWVRVDRHDYRMRPPAGLLERALRRLRDLDADRARRIDGVARLRTLPMAAPAVRNGDPQPLFRVPLLVDDRPAMIAKLERRVLSTGYIYDPPLDDYAGREFAAASPAPEVARSWSRRVVPVDPLEADQVLRSMV
jgi:dTDP-4-amino-4,6-dideoxygalactose transaminase